MLMLSNLGWLIGSVTLSVVIAYCALGIFIFTISKKFNIKLLSIMGISLIFAGISYLGIAVDFLTIVFTGSNLDKIVLAFLIWPFVPISFFITFYIGSEILIPRKKWYLLILYVILVIIFELSIFFNTIENVTFIEPNVPGEELIDDSLTFGSPAGLIGTFFTFTGLFLLGFGSILKGHRSKGVIRKKYYYLGIGWIIINISALLDFVGIPEIIIFVRIGSLGCVFFWYMGLREEPERITERPQQISEEEISFHREKKICLVCKGNVSRVNFMCPKCKTLYCLKCSEGLSNLENTCWVCNEPIDETKPVRPYKEEIQEIDLEISKKDDKKK